jgi:hypothetical protein
MSRIQFLVLDHDKAFVGDFISPALIVGIDDLAGHWVDELMTQSVAGPVADLPEGHLLFRGDRRVKTRESFR